MKGKCRVFCVRSTVLSFLVLALLSTVIGIGVAPAEQSKEGSSFLSQRDQMTLRMVQLAQAGRVIEARDVLRLYLQEHPTDGTMYYNLTCLDLWLKEKEQGLEDLERALRAV